MGGFAAPQSLGSEGRRRAQGSGPRGPLPCAFGEGTSARSHRPSFAGHSLYPRRPRWPEVGLGRAAQAGGGRQGPPLAGVAGRAGKADARAQSRDAPSPLAPGRYGLGGREPQVHRLPRPRLGAVECALETSPGEGAQLADRNSSASRPRRQAPRPAGERGVKGESGEVERPRPLRSTLHAPTAVTGPWPPAPGPYRSDRNLTKVDESGRLLLW